MIQFITDDSLKIDTNNVENLTYKELLQIECYFCIKINGKIFYEQPLFPLLEFIYFYKTWGGNADENFIYNTIESEDNPMISIEKFASGWKINSIWGNFDCNIYFELSEIVIAIDTMLKEISKNPEQETIWGRVEQYGDVNSMGTC